MAALNVVLILGSGNSLKAGMPSISEITDKLLNPGDVFYDNFSHFNFGKPWNEYDDGLEIVMSAQRGFKMMYELLKSPRHIIVNYEEVYDALREAHAGSDYGMLLREKLDAEYSKEYTNEHKRAMTMFNDITNGEQYVDQLVGAMLSKKPSNLQYLAPLVSLAKQFPNLQVCDLNHDTVYEQALNQSNVNFSTGFGETPPYNWSEWDRRRFESSTGIRIIKPHGCVDWSNQHLYYPGRNYGEIRILNIAIEDRAFYKPHTSLPNPYFPLLIIGTDNKLKDYTYSIFRSMQRVLDQSIMAADVIISSGYGFGDFGINQTIFARFSTEPPCKFILIDPKAKGLATKVSFGSRINWREVSGNVIAKKIEDMSLDELNNAVQSTSRILFDILEPEMDSTPFKYVGG